MRSNSIVLLLLLSCWMFAQSAMSQQPSSVTKTTATDINWRERRADLNAGYAIRIDGISKWCREQKLDAQVTETNKWLAPRDLNRQTIFLPAEKTMSAASADLIGQWQKKMNEANRWQAERIFELAKQAAAAEAGGTAFQLINETLHFDLDHAEARKILGHRKTDSGWRVAPDRIKVRTAKRKHEFLNWPAKSYRVVTTTNFQIESTASEERTRFLAESLERWHAVWRQVFFEYWSHPKSLQRWIDGKSSFRHSRKRFRVIFFQNRNEYIQQLTKLVKGIEISTGYYSSDRRLSFFYDSPSARDQDTWKHELTHQLFRESINTGKAPFKDSFLWLDEGMATYFESLAEFENHVTIGGFESRRAQYARVRLMMEQFYIPLAELSGYGRDELQAHPDVVQIYSQSAGLADMLINHQHGVWESKLIEFLKLLYKGRKLKPDTFEKVLGQNYAELDRQYREFLAIDSQQVSQYLSRPLLRTELSVPNANLQLDAFKEIGKCHHLNWIDLSGNRLTAEMILELKDCNKLAQVFLNKAQFEPGCLAAFRQFPNLQELDLSSSSVSDQQLLEIKKLNQISILRLGSTQLSDSAINELKKALPALQIDR